MPFLIDTVVEQSKIPNAGVGRFFNEDCEKDTIIRKQCYDSDELYVFKNEKNLELIDKEYIQKYGHSAPNDGEICKDIIFLNNPPLFTNHSLDSNIYFIYKEDEKYTLTSKNVKKGDEMYQDYSIYKKIDWFENYLKNNKKTSLREFGQQLNNLN